jgi:hypothetical protein
VSAVSTDLPPPFTLSTLHAELQAEAEELASRYAQRHREIRLHPSEHGALHPELWRSAPVSQELGSGTQPRTSK